MRKRIFVALTGIVLSFCMIGCAAAQDMTEDSETTVSSTNSQEDMIGPKEESTAESYVDTFNALCDSYSENGYTITPQCGEAIKCAAYIEQKDNRYAKYIILVPSTYTIDSYERLNQQNLLYQIASESSYSNRDGSYGYFYTFDGFIVYNLYQNDDGSLSKMENGFLMKEDFENRVEKYIEGGTINFHRNENDKEVFGEYYINVASYLTKISEPEIVKN